jgi:hypothetical protein
MMMNSQLTRTRTRIALAAIVTLAIGIGVAGVTARADVWDKKTVLTVHQPIQVQDTYLEPGTYVMKLASSSSNRHIVHIYNGEENRVINTILAIPTYRARPADGTQFTFYETPAGTAKAMRAWYYPGDTTGQEFRYPKHLRQIAMASTSRITERAPEPAPQPEFNQPAAPQPEPEPQASVEQPKSAEPELMAKAEPRPEPEPQQPAPTPKAQPSELPGTATWFPRAGLAGLMSLVAFGILRINRGS